MSKINLPCGQMQVPELDPVEAERLRTAFKRAFTGISEHATIFREMFTTRYYVGNHTIFVMQKRLPRKAKKRLKSQHQII